MKFRVSIKKKFPETITFKEKILCSYLDMGKRCNSIQKGHCNTVNIRFILGTSTNFCTVKEPGN